MRAGGVLLLLTLLAVLSLSSCVSSHRYFGGDGPPISLERPSEQQPAQSPQVARRIPYRPEVLSIGSARLAYSSDIAPIPTRTIEISAAPPPLPVTTPRRHIVAPGETLFAIARTRLGDEGRWREILAANPGLESPQLKAGQSLNLPR